MRFRKIIGILLVICLIVCFLGFTGRGVYKAQTERENLYQVVVLSKYRTYKNRFPRVVIRDTLTGYTMTVSSENLYGTRNVGDRFSYHAYRYSWDQNSNLEAWYWFCHIVWGIISFIGVLFLFSYIWQLFCWLFDVEEENK